MYVCNVDETGAQDSNPYIAAVKKIAESEGADTVVICGKFEAELADLESEEERLSFLAEVGLEESGLSQLARAAYHLIGLRTFLRPEKMSAAHGQSMPGIRLQRLPELYIPTLKRVL